MTGKHLQLRERGGGGGGGQHPFSTGFREHDSQEAPLHLLQSGCETSQVMGFLTAKFLHSRTLTPIFSHSGFLFYFIFLNEMTLGRWSFGSYWSFFGSSPEVCMSVGLVSAIERPVEVKKRKAAIVLS